MRHHDRPGRPEDPEPGAHPGGFAPDAAPEPAPEAGSAARTGGRHRKGGVLRPRRPSFRTAVTLAGAAAALLTVTTGMYVATVSGGVTAAAPGAVRGTAPGLPKAPPSAPTPSPLRKAPATPAVDREQAPAQPREQLAGYERHGVTPGAAPPAGKAGAVAPAGTTGAVTPAGKAARYVRDVVALANAEREKAGCAPLRSESRLRTAAQGHADDMSARDYYQHDNPEGRDAGDRITGAGYTWSTWGENIHRGPKTPARAMEDWMDSPGHRANILNCAFKDIGVGVNLTANGPWWVQDFGARR
ncbi:CAP domain-containing protein [Streptomyces venezuelae]|uniref:CAP domain-containing protein n=1 Tax=Streptomyces venezuelae TaxID=54571 RepID=UPI00168D928C|nr:CAP domain-containing protein [Streptomyces venezuelae]